MKKAKWYHQEDIHGKIIELKVTLDAYFKILGTDKYIRHRYGKTCSVAENVSEVKGRRLLKKSCINLFLEILSNMPYSIKQPLFSLDFGGSSDIVCGSVEYICDDVTTSDVSYLGDTVKEKLPLTETLSLEDGD